MTTYVIYDEVMNTQVAVDTVVEVYKVVDDILDNGYDEDATKELYNSILFDLGVVTHDVGSSVLGIRIEAKEGEGENDDVDG